MGWARTAGREGKDFSSVLKARGMGPLSAVADASVVGGHGLVEFERRAYESGQNERFENFLNAGDLKSASEMWEGMSARQKAAGNASTDQDTKANMGYLNQYRDAQAKIAKAKREKAEAEEVEQAPMAAETRQAEQDAVRKKKGTQTVLAEDRRRLGAVGATGVRLGANEIGAL